MRRYHNRLSEKNWWKKVDTKWCKDAHLYYASPKRRQFKKCRKSRRPTCLLPSKKFNQVSDSEECVIITKAEYNRKKVPSSKAGPSKNNYGEYEEVDKYRGDSDKDTDSDGPTFERIYGDDIAPAERSFTWLNGWPDAAISACQNEESSGIASRTRAKTMSAKKTAEINGDDTEVEVFEPQVVIEISSEDEPNESEKHNVSSSNKNEDEMNEAPEENEENNTILADNEPSGECTNLEREESALNIVSTEQCEGEKEHNVLKVPSRNKKNGKKVHKRNELSEKIKVRADAAPKQRRVQKKLSTAPCSAQSQRAKNSIEVEEMLEIPDQSRSDLCKQTTAGSLAVAIEYVATDDLDCDNEKEIVEAMVENEDIPAAGEIVKKQVKTKVSSLRPTDLSQALANSLLGQGPLIESESEDESRKAATNTHLPLKFSFEEVPKKKEKTEQELDLAAQFAEATLAFAMLDKSLREFPEVNSENKPSPGEETQEALCARGSHEVRQDDEIGEYCIHCHHVLLRAEDILPPWATKEYRKQGRKRSADGDELPGFVNKCRHVEPSRLVEPSVRNTAPFICPSDGTIWDVIPGLRERMYKHQQEGLEFLWKHSAGSTNLGEVKNMAKPNEVGGCMISHAPGTGKSFLTIAFLETYLKVFPDSRPLIIAPATMLLTWERQFKDWGCPFPFHNLNNSKLVQQESKKILKHFGGLKCLNMDTVRMIKMFSWDRKGSVLGISYSLFETLTGRKQENEEKSKVSMAENSYVKKSMRKILLEKPGLVIMDEGHIARNEKSNIWNALFKLETDKRVILSGTPFQNNLGELYNLLRLVRPVVANEIAEDKKLFEFNRESNKMEKQNVANKWKNKMLPYVDVHEGTTRRDLPGLKDSVILLRPQELQRKCIGMLKGQHAVTLEHKVASLSLHPYLFKSCGTPEKHPNIDMNLVEASKLNPNEGTKTKFIIELLGLSVAANEKVLIFSQYIQPLELIKEQLEERFNWVEGKHILHIGGDLAQSKRQILIDIYNDPLSEAKVMLASMKCCSEGISLVGASRVVMLDVVWNPSVRRQATCRAYRIGQNKHVYTYHLMTSGTTEMDKYRRQVEKECLSELVFCSSSRESDKGKNQASGCMEDKILEQMVGKFGDMFAQIISHSKENFHLTS